MVSKWYQFLSFVILGSIYAAIFLVPVFFLPFTQDYLDINKYYLLYALTLLGLLCWLSRAASVKVFEIRRTPLDLPLLCLWAALLISSILSRAPFLSFFGDYNLLNNSFLIYSILLIFYFLVVQNLSTLKRILNAVYTLMASGFLVSFYFILTSKKLIPALPPGVSLVSSSYTALGLFLVTILTLSLTVLVLKKDKVGLDIFSFLVFAASAAAIIMIGFKPVLLVATIALFLSLVFFLSYIEEVRSVWVSFSFALFIFLLFFSVIGLPGFLSVKLPLEISLGAPASWTIAYDSLTESTRNFLFGTGPASFPFNFSKYRPAGLNYNFAWNIRFPQPYSAAIDWLIQSGALGALTLVIVLLVALGIVIATWLKYVMGAKKKVSLSGLLAPAHTKPTFIFWGLAAGWLTVLIAFFLIGFGAVSWFAFWLLLGLLVVTSRLIVGEKEKISAISLKTTPQYALASSFAFISTCAAMVVLGVFLGRFYAAEVVYAQAAALASRGDSGLKKVNALKKAGELNPNRVQISLALAETYLGLAQEAASQQPVDINQVAPIIASAVNVSKRAAEIAPTNVSAWESLATMYANARPIASEANSWVINSLERAAQLEPTNPVLFIGLGNAKLLEKRLSEAQADFEKAIGLKSDFLLARLRLAAVFEAQNKLAEAIDALEKGLDTGLNNAQYLFELGRLYYNRKQGNDFGQAELALRRSIAIDPNYSDALFALAVLYERTNNRGPALELYKRVLQLNPDNKDLQRKVRSLYGEESGAE